MDSDDSDESDESAEPAAPAAEPEQGKPDKGPKEKKDKAPEQSVTLQGTVSAGTDEDGDPIYELASGGKTYQLEAGPPWFYGDNHPLKPFVGESVTVTGEAAEGSTEVDVLTVNGTAIREPGKPPWAGGWKRVGERHPGWSEEKAARWAEKAAKKRSEVRRLLATRPLQAAGRSRVRDLADPLGRLEGISQAPLRRACCNDGVRSRHPESVPCPPRVLPPPTDPPGCDCS